MFRSICLLLSSVLLFSMCSSGSANTCELNGCSSVEEITAEVFTAFTVGSCTEEGMGKYVLIETNGTEDNTLCGKTMKCYKVDYLKYTTVQMPCPDSRSFYQFTKKQE